MKGTDKQVKYAQDIVSKTKTIIQQTIDYYTPKAEQYPKLFTITLEEWKKAQEWYNRQTAEAEKRDMPASWYIDNKDRIGADAIRDKVRKEILRKENM